MGIAVAPTIMNIVVLTAVSSVLNSARSWAREGQGAGAASRPGSPPYAPVLLLQDLHTYTGCG